MIDVTPQGAARRAFRAIGHLRRAPLVYEKPAPSPCILARGGAASTEGRGTRAGVHLLREHASQGRGHAAPLAISVPFPWHGLPARERGWSKAQVSSCVEKPRLYVQAFLFSG